MADIGRSGCRNAGSSMPWPARLPRMATTQRSAISASSAPPRRAARRSDSSRANRQLRTCPSAVSPTQVTDAFVEEAARTGIDVFRVFDALNDVAQMRPAIDAVRATETAVAEVALCYTGNLTDPNERLYTLDYYLRLAERIVDAGAHVLAIKDMAGLLRPPAARTLVTALRERFDVPVHLHTHDTPGGQLATLLAAIDSGVDVVDAACASMAGATSQPALSALVAATDHSARETGLNLAAVCDLEPYWEAAR